MEDGRGMDGDKDEEGDEKEEAEWEERRKQRRRKVWMAVGVEDCVMGDGVGR